MNFTYELSASSMAIEKIKILGAMHLNIGPNWPNWQCCLAGSSKTAPRILIFSIAMDVDNSFYVKFIATYVPTFFWYIISVLARMTCLILLTGSSR